MDKGSINQAMQENDDERLRLKRKQTETETLFNRVFKIQNQQETILREVLSIIKGAESERVVGHILDVLDAEQMSIIQSYEKETENLETEIKTVSQKDTELEEMVVALRKEENNGQNSL